MRNAIEAELRFYFEEEGHVLLLQLIYFDFRHFWFLKLEAWRPGELRWVGISGRNESVIIADLQFQ